MIGRLPHSRTLSPRERLSRITLLEKTGGYTKETLEDVRGYFAIAYDRRDVLGAKRSGAPGSLRIRETGHLSPELVAVLERALRSNPGDRFPDLFVFANSLRQAAERLPLARRRRSILRVTAVALVATAALATLDP